MGNSLILLAQQEVAATQSTQYFFGINDPTHRFVVLLVCIGCLTLVSLIVFTAVATCWNSVRQKQIEAELKQDMLDRGMTAEEIEQVVKAQPKEGLDHWMEVWAKKKRR